MVVIFHLRKYFFIKFVFTITFLILLLVIYNIVEVVHHYSNDLNCKYDERIDVVYTWVNGSDPEFINNLNDYLQNKKISCDSSKQRYDDKFELKFSLRSLEKFAPWVNHIYIVTNGQIPYWLNLDYHKVSVITHEEIFKDVYNLPTFSSPAIESNLHRIPGLSNKFIYFNDDIFLASPLYPEDFYTSANGYLLYLAWPVPNCAPNCLWMYVNDGQCDKDCYVSDCQMDGDDCNDPDEQRRLSYDLTTENMEFDDENESVNITLTVSDRKEKSNFYHSVLKTLNSINETYKNPTSNILLNRSNLLNIVEEHNNSILKFDKLKRRRTKRNSLRRWFFEKIQFTKNIDAYSASLQYTNRVFNTKYGFHSRKVPSHAPILINREIMLDLENKFAKEFRITERNRVRRKDDLQYSFTYYNFIMSEKKNRTIEDIFNEFDTDSSNTWSDREIRTLLTQLYELPLSYGIVDYFEEILTNCSKYSDSAQPDISTPPYERYIDSKLPVISKYLVKECQYLSDILLNKFGTVFKYNFEIVSNSENKYISFTMLNSNVSDVVGNLDEIRKYRRKFVCLNDNLDESKESENELIKAILYDFYLSLFPIPSKFELPQELRNKFTRIKELNEWKYNRNFIKICLYIIFFIVFGYIFYNSCKKKCCQIANRLCC